VNSFALNVFPRALSVDEGRLMFRRLVKGAMLLVAALALAILAGCSTNASKDETAGWSADQLYREAHGAMLDGNYTRAAKLFETLEGRFPYGRYAQQSILEGAYSDYRSNETDTAIAACDRFIRTYPNHPNVDYALYLKGLIRFREDQGLLGYVYELDLSERDPKAMKESYAAFKELVTRFPESKYSEDGLARMKYLSNALAMYEVHVARYYYDRGAYLAAANRAQASLLNFPQNPANEDALEVLVNAYDKLGLPQLRDDSKAIMVKTYPDSKYLSPPPPKQWWKLW
jgi:outer membrane protein assembly factor BamD